MALPAPTHAAADHELSKQSVKADFTTGAGPNRAARL
jgi:hypothetical protein